MGPDFSVADAHLFTVLGWGKYVNLDLAPWAGLANYLGRVAAESLIPVK